MARTAVIERNKKRRRMAKKYAKKRAELKAAGEWEELQKLPKNSSPTRVNNRSFISGRSRGFMRDFGINRIEFRELANEGKIPGVRKSSW